MKKITANALCLILFCYSLHAQRLSPFSMSPYAAGGERGVAYPLQKNFFANLPSDIIPSYTKKDTTFYFVYLWLPKPVKELGLQLISPVPQFASAWPGDYEAEDYHDSLKAAGKYFNAQLLVERVLNISSPEEIFGRENKAAYRLLRRNNNLPLRIGATEKDTAFAPAGLYCITVASSENKKPEGTFVLQVGVTEKIPGMKIFRRVDELADDH